MKAKMSHGGKGSTRRPGNQQKFADNYDQIFRRNTIGLQLRPEENPEQDAEYMSRMEQMQQDYKPSLQSTLDGLEKVVMDNGMRFMDSMLGKSTSILLKQTKQTTNQAVTRLAMIGYLTSIGLKQLTKTLQHPFEIGSGYDDERNEFFSILSLITTNRSIIISVPLDDDIILAFDVSVIENQNTILYEQEFGILSADMNKTVTDVDIQRCFTLLIDKLNEFITGVPMETEILYAGRMG